jgi:hypothetical protein
LSSDEFWSYPRVLGTVSRRREAYCRTSTVPRLALAEVLYVHVARWLVRLLVLRRFRIDGNPRTPRSPECSQCSTHRTSSSPILYYNLHIGCSRTVVESQSIQTLRCPLLRTLTDQPLGRQMLMRLTSVSRGFGPQSVPSCSKV